MPSQTAKVTVYRTRYCPFCVAADRMLRKLGIDFEEVALDDHADRQGFTASILPGHYTVPLIVIDDAPIGGYQELMALESEGRLEPMIFGEGGD